MWLSKAADWLNRVVRPVSGVLHSVGVGVLLVMMFLTGADVTLRYVFNRPIGGSVELTEYMMAIVVAFGLAYCAVGKGHVRVDFIISRLSQRTQRVINSITGLLGIGLFSVATWQFFVYTKEQFVSGVRSTVLFIPAFPFVAIVALGSAALCLALVTDFLNFLSQAVKK